MAEKHKDAEASPSSARLRATARNPANEKPDSFVDGSRWASHAARCGCEASASKTAAAAMIHSGALQPSRSAAVGASSPTAMRPRGTPVGWIEKNRLRRTDGTLRISRSEEAGLIAP